MGLFKRKNIFYIRIQNKIVSTHTGNQKLALYLYKSALKNVLLSKLSCNGNKLKKAKTTKKEVLVLPAFDEYINTCELKNFTKRTINFKKYTKNMLINDLKIINFSDINQEKVNGFLSLIADKSPDTQKKFITEIKAFLNNSIKKGFFSQRKMGTFDFPSIKTKSKNLVVNESETKTIFDYLKENDIDFYMYLKTLYHTYSRPNEVTFLKAEFFDFEDNTVKIYQNKTQKEKKVYLNKDFCLELKKYIDDNDIKDTIFNGAKSPNLQFYGKKFKKLKKTLNINDKINLYTFRHTSITDLLNSTNDIEFASKQAGNNPEVALKHYVNRNDQHYKDLMEKTNK